MISGFFHAELSLVKRDVFMEWMTTTTVLDRLQDAADHSAWSGFVERYQGPVASFGRKTGLSQADADDVAQETMLAFLESYRKGAYQRGRGRLSQFLFGIARHKILHARRKIGPGPRQVSYGADAANLLADLPDADTLAQSWENEWRQSILMQCLERVREEVAPQTFEAFRLVAVEQVEPARVAEQLGMTRNAVFIAKHRVATRLRQLSAACEEEQ